MTRFFKMTASSEEPVVCDNIDESEFVEIFWNWQAFAVPMVLSLTDALERFNERFTFNEQEDNLEVIEPKTWLALLDYNLAYCSEHEARLLSQASLAMRPTS